MIVDRPKGMYTVAEASEAIGESRYSHAVIEQLIRSGEMPCIKVGRRRYVHPEDIERVALDRAGVRTATEGLDKIARLQGRVDQLEAENAELTRDLRRLSLRNEAAERDAEVMSAVDALSLLSLDESLAILSRIDLPDWTEGQKVYDAKIEIQRQMDKEDHRAFVGVRPRGVPKHAQRRTIATAIGEVDIWYWTTRGRQYRAGYGGPRAQWPVSRSPAFDTFGAAIKDAGVRARYAYGKPSRKSSARLRFTILERDGFCCHYCGRKPPEVELQVDHVDPVLRAGSNQADNLVAACRDCNLGKSGRALAE